MSSNSTKSNWTSIFVFYFLACIWSWPFFWWRDIHSDSWNALELPRFFKTWLIMWGPGISAVICFVLFKSHHRNITFKGTNLWWGVAFYSLLPISFVIWNQSYSFLYLGALGFISILGEELGWRGFLQDALKIKSDFFKALIIGFMWEIWHFTNRTANNEPQQAVKMIVLWILITTFISFVTIKFTHKTRSLFIAITIHSAVNAGFEFQNGWKVLLTCLPFWLFLFWKWPNREITH